MENQGYEEFLFFIFQYSGIPKPVQGVAGLLMLNFSDRR
jgi:hypothetical protein